MSLYAVKNDKGDYLNGVAGEKPLFGGLDKDCVLNGEDAGWLAGRGYGHVVELVEAPAKVVVSEDEAEMLERAKKPSFQETSVIDSYVTTHGGAEFGCDIGDRLMRAYVNDWVVEKPKLWNVKVPHAEKTLYRKHDSGALFASIYVGPQNHANDFLFTLAEIEHYGLGDCERVEVSDD